MTAWRIFASPEPTHAALVVAFDWTRPDENLTDLAATLASQGVNGPVAFDLLLANGLGSHRFFTFPFDGQQFDLRALERIVTPSTELLRGSAHLLAQHWNLLDVSLLTADQREAVRTGTVGLS